MNTLIVYATTHGTTGKVAQKIKEGLDVPCILINLKTDDLPDLSEYQRIIVGGSIHAGQIQSRIKDFCRKNTLELLQKQLALYICCMHENELAEQQFTNAFPEILRNHAQSKKIMGGEYLFEKMNFFQKVLVRKIAGVNETQSRINEPAICEFISELMVR
jgi:menaquinone-dependent protoporphyrinogen oxidase